MYTRKPQYKRTFHTSLETFMNSQHEKNDFRRLFSRFLVKQNLNKKYLLNYLLKIFLGSKN
jgi:hypothetical protein